MTYLSSIQKPKELPPHAGSRRREALIGLLFLSPWILGIILLKLLPILAALALSLTNFHMLAPEKTQFIGLANYTHFLGDLMAWASLAESLGYFLVTVPLELLIALALAAILSSGRLHAKGLLRPLVFMPSIIPVISVILIWYGLVDPYTGWLNILVMNPLGLPPLSTDSFNTLVILMALWSIGPGFLIMYGAMQNIPKEIIEAARVDGAGPLLRFIRITLPIISPAIFFSLVIDLASAFGGSVLLDRGGVLSQMDGYINTVMFSYQDLGYATALAWVTFAMTMTITIFLFRSAQRWVYFPEETEHDAI